MSTSSADGIRWDLNDLFSSHDDPRIETTLTDCHVRAEAFATRFRPVMEHSETLTADSLLDAIRGWKSSMKRWDVSAAMPDCFTRRIRQIPTIRTWTNASNSARRRFVICCFFLKSNGSRPTT